MLRHFLIVWLFYWTVVALLPVHSIYPATTQALLLQMSFVAIVAICIEALLAVYKVRRMPECGRSDIECTPKLILIAIAMSIVGLAALLYDKVSIQGIDYSEGVAAAREEWRRIGMEREGQTSSIFSVIGYFFGSAYYVATVLAITQTRVLSAHKRATTLLVCFSLLVANSVLTGGRSSILLIVPIVISAYGARRGIRGYSRVSHETQRRIIKVLGILAGAYAVFIFYQRASAGDLDALEYALDFLPFLGVEADDWYRNSLGSGPLDALSAMLVLATAYVTHSFSTVAAIVDAPLENKTIIFQHMSAILYKLGLANSPESDWFLAGRAPSLPGALWHQFGLFGFVTGSMLLGFACASAKVWTVRKPNRLLPLGAYTLAEATLMLSPALFAADFLSFPFVLTSFATLAMTARIIRTRSKRSSALGARPSLHSPRR